MAHLNLERENVTILSALTFTTNSCQQEILHSESKPTVQSLTNNFKLHNANRLGFNPGPLQSEVIVSNAVNIHLIPLP
jgi:hypothetical protein